MKRLSTENKKGITITSLTIYVIVATIVVTVLVFLNANFFSNINELTNKAGVVSELLNFKSAFIRDLKSENNIRITEYNDNMIRLSNDVKYEIRVLEKNVLNKKYAIYRNDVQIAKNIVKHGGVDVKEGPYFEYDADSNTIKLGISFSDGKNTYVENGNYSVGRGMQDSDFRVPENEQVIIPSGDVEADEIRAVLYVGGLLNISKSGKNEIGKDVEKDYGEISSQINSGTPSWTDVDKIKIVTVNFSEPIKVLSLENLFAGCRNLTEIQNIQNIDTSEVVSAANAFRDCEKLTDINLRKWQTDSITDMSNMFSGCSSLKGLEVVGWNIDNLQNMDNMFAGCTKLSYVNMGNCNTSNVTSMNELFYGCENLKNIYIKYFNTSKVNSLENLFFGCKSLLEFPFDTLDTSHVTTMSGMFQGCESLEKFDFQKIDTSNVVNMSNMFCDCKGITNFLNISNLKTSNVTNMMEMFKGCSNLTTLNLEQENIYTTKVTNMSGMFENCTNLKTLNLKNFNTSNVTNMDRMFKDAQSLTTIDVSSLWDDSNASKVEMFDNCGTTEVTRS